MNSENRGKTKVLTTLVIVTAVSGIIFFGYRAIREASNGSRGNPFEYDIERFKTGDPDLVGYFETTGIPLEFEEARAIAVGPDDRIYVSGDRSVVVFDSRGEKRAAFPTETTAGSLCVGGGRRLYLGMIDHVEAVDLESGETTRWESPGEKAVITSVAVSDRYLFAADAGNLIVWKYDKKGTLLGKIGEKDEARDIPGFIIPSPFFDVAVDSDGFLWVADTGRHSLENYTEDGDFRTSWGEPAMDIEGFCGCCNPSHFALLEDDSFVTSEKGIPRIKVSNRLGNLVSVVAGPDQFFDNTVGLDLAVDSAQRILVLDPGRKFVRIFMEKEARAEAST